MGSGQAMQELKELAQFISEVKFSDLPTEVVEHAKWVLRDSIGVIIAGMAEPEVKALADFAVGQAPGPATIFGHPGSVSPEWAAMVHGTAGTSLEMDEGHAFARGHASIHAVPPAIALGQVQGVSGQELITALVVGYEVAARAGIASRLKKDVHPFGAWGVLGAAAVGAKFNHMDAESIVGVLEVAASYAITPSFETAYQGANVRNTYAGIVNYLGLLAVQFYSLGFRGEVGGLNTAFGQILGNSFDPKALNDGLGERYEIMRGYFKPYSACRYAHGTIDALLALIDENQPDVEKIQSVEVATYDIASGLRETAPKTPLAGRFSIPYVVATTLSLGSAGPEVYAPEVLSDPKILSLAELVNVVEDPEYTKLTPAKRPARVTIKFKDGKQIQNIVMGSKGDPDQPMTPQELEDKYFALTGVALGDEKARSAWDSIGNLEELSDISFVNNTLNIEN